MDAKSDQFTQEMVLQWVALGATVRLLKDAREAAASANTGGPNHLREAEGKVTLLLKGLPAYSPESTLAGSGGR